MYGINPQGFVKREWRPLEHENGVKKYLMATRIGAGPNKFYVYLLVDPRTGEPFYVGKGKGNRCHEHRRGAVEGRRGGRYTKIRELIAAGFECEIRKVKWFDDNTAALEYEGALIWTIGPKNLTNVSRGLCLVRDA